MNISQLTDATGSSGVQAMGGGHHHHHHESISEQVSQMGSAIDSAVQAGTMTSAQATTLKSELSDITNTLGLASSTSTTATTSTTGSNSQSNPLSQLSEADRKKVSNELPDVRKQLYAASNTQGANASSGASGGNDAVSKLFSMIDTDGNE